MDALFVTTPTKALDPASDCASNRFANLGDRSAVVSIVNVDEPRYIVLHHNQRGTHKEFDGRLGDEKMRAEVAMFHCCEANAGGKRHEQRHRCQPSARETVVWDGGHG